MNGTCRLQRSLREHLPSTYAHQQMVATIIAMSALAAPTATSAQAVRLTEIRRLTAEESNLSRVGLVATDSAGNIWVSQPQDGHILFFGSDLSAPLRIGRQGEGPGDFRLAQQIVPTARGVWVFDRILSRATTFDAKGKLTGTQAINSPDVPTGAMLQVGTPEGASWWQSRNVDRTISVLHPDSKRLAPVGTADRNTCAVTIRTERGANSLAAPLCQRPREEFSPDGRIRASAIPLPSRWDSTRTRIVVLSMRGDTITNLSVSLPALPVPERVRDSTIAALTALPTNALGEALVSEILSKDLVGRVYPQILDVDVSLDGEVALTTRRDEAGTKLVLIIGRAGQKRGSFAIAANKEIGWFDRDRIILLESDEDGLQDVVLYRMSAR